ncbi:hypothetical protein HanPI659440_Chr11g0412051 [Helianthus annuus]|nr:hypothetical protein HanPI659440_Chr11g0412051 [Helianthus annuus]
MNHYPTTCRPLPPLHPDPPLLLSTNHHCIRFKQLVYETKLNSFFSMHCMKNIDALLSIGSLDDLL